MSTKIEWTEETWNPVTGCTKCSPGCDNCYAETIAKRFWGDQPFSDVQCHEDRLNKPLHWRNPRKIFVCSMSDLFHPKVPFEFVDKVFDTIEQCPQHICQILTKRPEPMLEYFQKYESDIEAGISEFCIGDNVWLGVSISTQKEDEKIPILLQIPAAVRFVSLEPMLEDIVNPHFLFGWQCLACGGTNWRELHGQRWCDDCGNEMPPALDWLIIGCESGPKRRPCKLEWVKSLVEQCKAASVPVFVKQLSINGKVSHNPEEWPPWARKREYPRGER